ncbi:MAG: cation:proton antiporter [Bacteroidales bacterium]
MNVDLTILFFGMLVFSAHLFSSIYTRKKIPDVLLLILIGLLLGPILHLIQPTDLGAGGPVFVAMTLVVILFDGGTSLDIQVMQSAWKSTINITCSCFFASLILTAAIGIAFAGMSYLDALILGSILGGTSSAVVIPLVRQLNMGEKSKTVLILESAATDVLCIVFALAFLHAYKLGTVHVGNMIGNVFSSFLLAGVIGFLGALIWSRLITKMRKLQNSIFTTPAFVFIIYGIAQLLGYSGAIAALIFGVTMANIDTIRNRFLIRIMGGRGHKLNTTEMVFFGEIVFLLKTVLFVYIGISIVFNDLLSILVGLGITLALLIGRTLIIKFIAPNGSSVFDKTIVSMMIPKGLAAAVLASIPEQMGLAGGTLIKNITYSVIFFSILLVSILILLVEKSKFVQKGYGKIFGGTLNSNHATDNIKTQDLNHIRPIASMTQDLVQDTETIVNIIPISPSDTSSEFETINKTENTSSDSILKPTEDTDSRNNTENTHTDPK